MHEEGYGVERLVDGALQFRTPYGWVLPDVPPSPSVPADPVAALRASNESRGLQIDARTALPSWTGEPLDLDYAISVLHPLTTRPSLPAW